MVNNQWIDPNELFAEIEKTRETGEIRRDLTTANPCYQVSRKFPGCIERIFDNGKKDIGLFANGKFQVDQGKTYKYYSE